MGNNGLKKCPFCAEEIQEAAVKCRYCGEFLDGKQTASREKWYFKTPNIVVGFLLLGPLILPLVWWHPRYSRQVKLITTAVALVLTYFLSVALTKSVRSLTDYYQMAFNPNF